MSPKDKKMLHLYHGDTSVCSIKARVGLTEKGAKWDGTLVNLGAGEQSAPAFRKLNPEGVVPVLTDDDLVVRESSAIISYVDFLSAQNPLTPADARGYALTQMWLVRSIEIHASINTMSFSTAFRERDLAKSTPEVMEAKFRRLANPQIVEKRRDMYKNGAQSVYVDAALHTLNLMLADMQSALQTSEWLAGEAYTLSDVSLIGYVDRLERLAMAGLWEKRFPEVARWLHQSRQRPSYQTEVLDYIPQAPADEMRSYAERSWPAIAEKLSV